MKKLLLIGLLGSLFIGCTSKTLTITKCKSYKNGICVAKDVREVKLCSNPTKIDGKIYCEE
jgi:hypothetical protein